MRLYPRAAIFCCWPGIATAGASLIRPGELFAAADAAKPERILVPANAHPAIQCGGENPGEEAGAGMRAAIATYEGRRRPTAGVIVLALAKDGKLAAADMPKKDGYTVTYTGGMIVYGARPRSLLFAAGEPEHGLQPRTAPYQRNPDFAIRNARQHTDYPVAEQVAIFSANMFTATCAPRPRWQALPDVSHADAAQQKQLVDAAATHTAENAARVKEFHDADVEVYALLPYGNNFATWSRELYAAVLKAYPTAKGTLGAELA